jgi:hypothetical protein
MTLNQEEENPKWQEHTLLLSLAAMDLQNGKVNSREAGGHIYRPSKGGWPLEKVSWKSSTVGWTDGLPLQSVGSSGH